MKNLLLALIVLFCFCATSCNRTQCKSGINLLPMYGNVEKCKEQIETDNQFLANCDENYPSRKVASEDMLRYAWRYYSEGNLDTAMKRFNQAWLLDSLNADVYLGFGEILIDKGQFEESIQYLDKSIKLDPQKSGAYRFLGLAYSCLFDETKKQEYLDKSIEQLKESALINPTDANTYALLTNTYLQSNQQDSALKYMEITDKLNPNLIKQEERDLVLAK